MNLQDRKKVDIIAMSTDLDPRRALRIGLQCLVVACAFMLLGGCMRQDYRFIGNMMDTDGFTAVTPQHLEESAAPTPERMAEMPVSGVVRQGRG